MLIGVRDRFIVTNTVMNKIMYKQEKNSYSIRGCYWQLRLYSEEGGMIIKWWSEKDSEGNIYGQVKKVFRHLPRTTEDKHEISGNMYEILSQDNRFPRLDSKRWYPKCK